MSYLERGNLLLQQRRFQEAETEFKKALADYPNDFMALALLAESKICQRAYPEGLEFAQRAIAIEPNQSFLIFMLARAYFVNNQAKLAKEQLLRGLQLYPTESSYFRLLGEIEFFEEHWDKALENAENGLALDPSDVDLINLRARSLVQLNRKDEAEETMDYALRSNPEDSYSHANKGWVYINKNQMDEALASFQEALRLNPENTYARNGLKEAIKAKNPAYRFVLQYFLWMGRMSETNRWGFIIGIYIVYRIILWAAQNSPNLAPFLYPLVFVYVLFAFSSWIAVPFSNFVLRFHKLGRHAMDDDELLGSAIVGGSLFTGLATLITFYLTGIEFLLLLGGFFILMLIPLGATFSVSSEGKARKRLLLYDLGLTVVGLTAVFVPPFQEIGAMIFLVGIFLFTWIANYLIGSDNREFR